MQSFLLVPEADWNRMLGRLNRLEEAEQTRAVSTAAPDDTPLTTIQAAECLGLSPEALRRARRAGRIQGVRLNEKDWGFRPSALERYPRRYHRATQRQAA